MIKPIIAGVIAGAATAGGNLIENHAIDLTTVASVGSIVMAGVWWLSGKFQKQDDSIQELSRMIQSLPCVRDGRVDDCKRREKK